MLLTLNPWRNIGDNATIFIHESFSRLLDVSFFLQCQVFNAILHEYPTYLSQTPPMDYPLILAENHVFSIPSFVCREIQPRNKHREYPGILVWLSGLHTIRAADTEFLLALPR
jgi:hypothetical protein